MTPSAPFVSNWTRIFTGKVHDVYTPVSVAAHGAAESLMIVASDRISVYDRVLPTLIPGKAALLTDISVWWFNRLREVLPNHFISSDVDPIVQGRAIIARRLRMYPVECMVYGYVTESAIKDFREIGLDGVDAMRIGQRLDTPVFVPSIKGPAGSADQTITFEQLVDKAGAELAAELRDASLALYEEAAKIATAKGLVIADCKLEFGAPIDSGEDDLVLGDQAFTPDSATYWLRSEFEEACGGGGSTGGNTQTSGNAQAGEPGTVSRRDEHCPPRAFGKDYVRQVVAKQAKDWVTGVGPAPELEPEVVDEVKSRYSSVHDMLLK